MPKSPQYHLKCADLLLESGDEESIQEAVEVFEDGINANPYSHEIYIAYGDMLQNIGEDSKAKKIYEEGLKSQPNSESLYIAYGTLLQKIEEDDKAKKIYEEGISAYPN